MNGARWIFTLPTGSWILVCPQVLPLSGLVPYHLIGAGVLANVAQRRS